MSLHISEPHASYPPEETYLHAFLDDRQHDQANHQPARKLPLIPFCPDALSALRDHRVTLTPEFLLPSHRQNPGALPTNCPIRDMISIPHAHTGPPPEFRCCCAVRSAAVTKKQSATRAYGGRGNCFSLRMPSASGRPLCLGLNFYTNTARPTKKRTEFVNN